MKTNTAGPLSDAGFTVVVTERSMSDGRMVMSVVVALLARVTSVRVPSSKTLTGTVTVVVTV